MVKKYLFGLFVVLLLLASCSSNDDVGVNDSMNDSVNGTVVDASPVVDTKPVEKVKVEEPVETTYSSDLLIKKRIGSYHFEKEEFFKAKKHGGYSFDTYVAHYSYGKTDSVVSILVSAKSSENINLYNYLNDVSKESAVEVLDNEDFDFFNEDIYFNPLVNTYYWLSDDKVLIIQYTVGLELLQEYLEEYPPSVISGHYNSEVTIKLEGKKDEENFFFNNNQYIITLVDLSGEEISISVNGEEGVFSDGEEFVLGNLLLKPTISNMAAKEVSVKINREVLEKVSYTLDVGDSVEFEMLGKKNSLIVEGSNSDKMTLQINLNGNTRSLVRKVIKTFGDFDVRLDDLFISNIGTKKTTAKITIWPKE